MRHTTREPSLRPWRAPALGLIAALGLLLGPSPARAGGAVVVKLATLAPEDSTWHKGLRQMGDRWAEISGGEVQLKIYAGGVAGNEGAMVRKMRIGQIHASALSNLGLLDIDAAPQAVSMPLLIESYDELDHVMTEMGPVFEQRLAEQGFVVLNWGEAGWAHFFTNEPMRTPADARNFKVFAWEGDPAAVKGFKQAGFNPVVIPSTDVLPSLQSGLIDGFPNTPLYALSAQWFGLAPYMLEMGWAPLVGATVVTQEMWDQIPAKYHAEFLAAAREVGEGLKEEIRRQDRKAIEVMKKYGLTVVEIDGPTRQAWKDQIQGLYPMVRQEIIPTEVWDQTRQVLRDYRASR